MLTETNTDVCSPLARQCPHSNTLSACLTCSLDESCYFSSLPEPAKLALQQGMKKKIFPRLSVLDSEISHENALYLLKSGEVMEYHSCGVGCQQIRKISAIPGDLIAYNESYLKTSGMISEAISDTTACLINREFLRQTAEKFPEISDTIRQITTRNQNAYNRHIANLGSMSAERKVASYLVFQHETHHWHEDSLHSLADSLTRVEMAEMLGLTQDEMINCLKTLTLKRIILVTKNGFMVLDMDALTSLAEGTEAHS